MNTAKSELLVSVSRLFNKNLPDTQVTDFEKAADAFAETIAPAKPVTPPLTDGEIEVLRLSLRAAVPVTKAE